MMFVSSRSIHEHHHHHHHHRPDESIVPRRRQGRQRRRCCCQRPPLMLLAVLFLALSTIFVVVNSYVPSWVSSSSSSSSCSRGYSSFTVSYRNYGDGQRSSSIVDPRRRRRRPGMERCRNSCLNMMFDQLSSAITGVVDMLGPRKKMTEENIQPALREVRRALLDADVNIKVADTLIEGVKRRALGTEIIKGVTADQQFIKNMYDELLDIMGGGGGGDNSTSTTGQQQATEIGMVNTTAPPVATLARGTPERPAVILLAGLQGAGKTTAAGKLALYLKEREVDYDAVNAMGVEESSGLITSRMPKTTRRVLLVAADVYRPAAIKQLQILGERVNVDVYSMGTDADPVVIARNAVAKAKSDGFDTVIVDTAGRQVIDTDLMNELRQIKRTVKPDETLLVVDAMTGQEAASLTASFDEAVGITGAVLTKMDGDSRGGAAVSVRGVSGRPIKFVGTGEKDTDMEPFYPERMASRILGKGDVVSLVEKAAAEVSDAEAARIQQRMRDGAFDFNDFLKQSEMLNNMGSMSGVAKMLPGVSGMVSNKQLFEAEKRLERSKTIIAAMSDEERSNPDLLIRDRSARTRLNRITAEVGVPLEDGLNVVSEFQRMRTMMSRMSKQMERGMGAAGSDPSGGGGGGDDMPDFSNRAMRRAAKKQKKKGRGSPKGFG